VGLPDKHSGLGNCNTPNAILGARSVITKTTATYKRLVPPALVAIVVALNLWWLRATLLPVAYLNDSAMHEQMVRYAASSFRSGRDPLSGWYPYLNLGSPQFLHYQALGAMVTGLAGTVVGPDTAFRWSLYLLVACWPLTIYLSARIFRFEPWVCATAAVIAALVGSIPQIGYEQDAYLWVGYGLWAQLWGSLLLPFAWATTWRACTNRHFILPAALCVALTVSLHYETGYLAIAPVVAFPLLVREGLRRRLLRAALVAGTAMFIVAWTLLPLMLNARWAAINQALHGTPLENGYGARTVLTWLVTGGIFDSHGPPLITSLVGLGAIVVCFRWRRDHTGRALMFMFLLSLLMCFGRTTFGSLVDIVPASHDIFFRRFMLGVQLSGVYLAGIGTVSLCRGALASARILHARMAYPYGATGAAPELPLGIQWGAVFCALVLIAVVMTPAFARIERLDARNSAAIESQRATGAKQARDLNALISYVESHPGGRVYAGSPNNWGMQFTVGSVQVFKYLASVDVNEVGFTLRTASLMSQPEFHFDDTNPSDYSLFGVRYLILPVEQASPVPAVRLMIRGQYTLWEIPGNGYINLVETIGTLTENRSNVGARSIKFLDSDLFALHRDFTVRWSGSPGAPLTDPHPRGASPGPPGMVLRQSADPPRGTYAATVDLRRPAVVVLSASYDPGWTATVNGRVAATQMVAPAVVGVAVPAGSHRVIFTYRGFPYYDVLWLLALFGVGAGAMISFGRREWFRRSRASDLLGLALREC